MAVTMTATVPEGVASGGYFSVSTPDGQVLQLQAPDAGTAGYGGAGSAVSFAYMPKAPGMEDGSACVEMHADDRERFEAAMAAANAKQEELAAAGVVAATAPPAEEFVGFQFPPATFSVGENAIVTRSDGSESGCTITEVFLTALGPLYVVYLGQGEDGTPITKNAEGSDLRKYE
eukprot:gb/GFBE01041261.1/.p1 GENE.gb/GFBE01041261.1/~~gb/GFBE01041261.1/.p1  ORF type:complete len:175 (+),score=46.40 gb/GFBE01041261.1/:1-525(+)